MELGSRLWGLSRRSLAALVYVIIALVAAGLTVSMGETNVQWFSSVREVTVTIVDVSFHLDDQIFLYPAILVHASAENPTSFGTLQVADVSYSVFVNSTSKDFSIQSSSQVGSKDTPIGQFLPPRGTLNVTSGVRVFTDVVDPLRTFLNAHPKDLRIFVQITLNLNSSVGPIAGLYCYEMPSGSPTICPSPRAPPPRGAGGG